MRTALELWHGPPPRMARSTRSHAAINSKRCLREAPLDNLPNRRHRRHSPTPPTHLEHRLRRSRSAAAFPRARSGRRRLFDRLRLRQRLQRTVADAHRDGLRSGRNFERIAVQFRRRHDRRRSRRGGSSYPQGLQWFRAIETPPEFCARAAPAGTPNRVEFGFRFSTAKTASSDWSLKRPVSLHSRSRDSIFCLARATFFAAADGTDMLDCVTEIPLPGRILAPTEYESRSPHRRESIARIRCRTGESSRRRQYRWLARITSPVNGRRFRQAFRTDAPRALRLQRHGQIALRLRPRSALAIAARRRKCSLHHGRRLSPSAQRCR